MRKSDVISANDVEEYYNKCRKIKFGDEEVVINSLEDVAINLFKYRGCTTYMRGGYHCEGQRARSFDDYFKLTKQYYPKSSIKDAIQAFFNIQPEDKVMGIRYCPNIKKTNTTGGFIPISYQPNTRKSLIELGFSRRYKLSDFK